MPSETWHPVPGYETSHEVSDLGHVRSLSRRIVTSTGVERWWQGRLMSPSPHPDGYLYVCLASGGRGRTHRVHRLVLAAFVGPCPNGHEGLHTNGDKRDNRVSNLRYGTRSQNTLDQVGHGRHNQASKTRCLRGHLFTEANTYVHPSGRRVCRQCRAIHYSAYVVRRAEVTCG